MKKIKLATCMVTIVLAAPIWGGKPHDGYMWRTFSQHEKNIWVAAWMEGFLQARCGDFDSLAECLESLSWLLGRDFQLTGPRTAEAVGGPYLPQVAEGMDRFYAADFRNMRVPMSEAVVLVTMTVRGAPDDIIRARASALRKIYCGAE
jgi:hypothetical protein